MSTWTLRPGVQEYEGFTPLWPGEGRNLGFISPTCWPVWLSQYQGLAIYCWDWPAANVFPTSKGRARRKLGLFELWLLSWVTPGASKLCSASYLELCCCDKTSWEQVRLQQRESFFALIVDTVIRTDLCGTFPVTFSLGPRAILHLNGIGLQDGDYICCWRES